MGHENSGRRSIIAMRPDRSSIEKEIVLETRSMAEIARRVGCSYDSVKRYKDKIPEERRREIILAQQREMKDVEDAELNEDQVEISSSMKTVLREIEKILNKVKDEDDHVLSLTALRDMRATLMDLGKLYGQLNDKTTIQVSINEAPEWVQLRLILGDVFRDHPVAGTAFLERANRERLSIAGQPV